MIEFAGVFPGRLSVQGDVTWNSGTYKPRVNGEQVGYCDGWLTTGTFTIGGEAVVHPIFLPDENDVDPGDWWDVLVARKNFVGVPPSLPAGLANNYEMVKVLTNSGEAGHFRRK